MPVTNWSSSGGTSVTLPPPSHPLVSLINSWPANNWNSFHTVDVQRIRQRKLGKQCHFVLKQCFCVSWLRLANYHNESCPERATGANINIPKVCFYEWANYTKKIESLSAALKHYVRFSWSEVCQSEDDPNLLFEAPVCDDDVMSCITARDDF